MVTWPRRADFSVSFDSALKWLNSVQEINFGPLHLFSLIFSRILTDSISGSFHLVAASLVLTYTHTHQHPPSLLPNAQHFNLYEWSVSIVFFHLSLWAHHHHNLFSASAVDSCRSFSPSIFLFPSYSPPPPQ